MCWGGDLEGQLGDGTTESHHQPASPLHLAEPMGLLSSVGSQVCAALRSGELRCWGNNAAGQAGIEPVEGRYIETDPVAVTGLGGPVRGLAGIEGSHCAGVGQGLWCPGSPPSAFRAATAVVSGSNCI